MQVAMAAVVDFEPEPAPEGASEVVLIPSKDSQNGEGEAAEEDELFGEDAPTSMAPENDEGNQEYKLQLINPSPERFVHLVTQCQFRVSEGECPSARSGLPAPSKLPMQAFFPRASCLIATWRGGRPRGGHLPDRRRGRRYSPWDYAGAAGCVHRDAQAHRGRDRCRCNAHTGARWPLVRATPLSPQPVHTATLG